MIRRLFLSGLSLTIALSVVCQPAVAPQPEIDYLKRSRSQKKWGNTLIAISGIAVGLVLLSQANAGPSGGPSDPTGGLVFCGATLAGGIVLLSSAAKNKKKANGFTTNLKLETSSFKFAKAGLPMYPAGSVKLAL